MFPMTGNRKAAGSAMISFSLRCGHGHSFDGWFRSGDEFERQSSTGLLSCPECGSTSVAKALMAPAVTPSDMKAAVPTLQEIRAYARKFKENAENVGDGFAAEARRMHEDEGSDDRRIYGTATPDEIRGLQEDGIGYGLIPDLDEGIH
jgi:hypothetical protein